MIQNTMSSIAEDFESTWSFVVAMTISFARAVPASKWDFSPHPRFSGFAKQLRHLICVQRAHYSGSLEAGALIEGFQAAGAEFSARLRDFDLAVESPPIDFFGTPMGFAEYTSTVINHFLFHHGQWSLYAALGGFDPPQEWKSNWEIG